MLKVSLALYIPRLTMLVSPTSNDVVNVKLQTEGTGAPSAHAQVNVQRNPDNWRNSGVEGLAEFDLGPLAAYSALLPELQFHEGQLSGQATIRGLLGAPAVTGAITLKDGELEIVETGVRLKAVQAVVKTNAQWDTQSALISFAATGTSGHGTFSLEGEAHPSMDDDELWSGVSGSLHLTGDHVRIADTDSAQLTASPYLWLNMDADGLSLTGRMDVDRARIHIREQPINAVRTSPDQKIVGDVKGRPSETGLRQSLDATDVRVRLGDDTQFKGFGLDTPLTGALRLKQRSGRITANGSIRTKTGGRYSAWGQTLDIREGRLFWSDTPLTRPALDVEASRSPTSEVTVGLMARGPLANPRIELFSNPAMGQSDQLSWLLFGRPMQPAASAGETSLVNQAAATIGIGADNLLARRYGDRLPVNIGIEVPAGQTQESAALVVGRHVTPELYVS